MNECDVCGETADGPLCSSCQEWLTYYESLSPEEWKAETESMDRHALKSAVEPMRHGVPMTSVLNPVDIETGIRELSNRIANGVQVVSNSYAEFLASDRAYDRAYAHAYLDAEGPAHERKYRAELATDRERSARDVADVQFRYADRTAKALELELRALQSIGASVRAMFGVAGRGES